MGAATDVLLGIANGSSKQVLHDYKLKVAFPRRRTSATQKLIAAIFNRESINITRFPLNGAAKLS